MSHRSIAPGLYELRLGQVNAHLIDDQDDGLTLIDTGYPGSAATILGAIRELGRSPDDLRHIIVTHCHEDHAGSLAELKRFTPARSYMHAIDAAMTRAGCSLRPLLPGPGLLNGLIYRLIIRKAQSSIEPAEVDHDLADGEALAIAGGLRVIHAPGHCAGQIALHWPRHGGVLFAADTCASVFGLAMSPAYEDIELGRQTLSRLALEDFAIATFGHGKPITGGAAAKFRRKFKR